jgi:hypothetical protein
MSRLPYSSDELAAFSAADRLADDMEVSKDDVRKLLNALAGESYRTREHLDRALHALAEKNSRKREQVRDLINAERDS